MVRAPSTVHTRPPSHAVPVLDDETPPIEVFARPADHVTYGLGVGLEVRLVARGLDMREVVLRVRPGLEHEDA